MVDDDDDVVENAWTSVLLLCRPLFQSSAAAATSSDVKHWKLFVVIMVGFVFCFCFCCHERHFFLFCQTGFDTTRSCLRHQINDEVAAQIRIDYNTSPVDRLF